MRPSYSLSFALLATAFIFGPHCANAATQDGIRRYNFIPTDNGAVVKLALGKTFKRNPTVFKITRTDDGKLSNYAIKGKLTGTGVSDGRQLDMYDGNGQLQIIHKESGTSGTYYEFQRNGAMYRCDVAPAILCWKNGEDLVLWETTKKAKLFHKKKTVIQTADNTDADELLVTVATIKLELRVSSSPIQEEDEELADFNLREHATVPEKDGEGLKVDDVDEILPVAKGKKSFTPTLATIPEVDERFTLGQLFKKEDEGEMMEPPTRYRSAPFNGIPVPPHVLATAGSVYLRTHLQHGWKPCGSDKSLSCDADLCPRLQEHPPKAITTDLTEQALKTCRIVMHGLLLLSSQYQIVADTVVESLDVYGAKRCISHLGFQRFTSCAFANVDASSRVFEVEIVLP